MNLKYLSKGGVGLLFSGGMDSTSALALLDAAGCSPVVIEIDHNSRSPGERIAAELIAVKYGVKHIKIKFERSGCAEPISSAAPSAALLISLAEHVAREHHISNLVMATIREDWESHGTPQAGRYYYGTLQRLLDLHSSHPVRLHFPFYELKKRDLARLATASGAPLSLSWSCVLGTVRHCGKCLPCIERRHSLKNL